MKVKTKHELIELARKMYAEGSNDDIEIDDGAELSEGDDGTWVQAWVWVPNDDDDDDEEED